MTNQNTVLIIGSGRSGRGMLGELYHKAGFHIVFADNDPSLVNGLRAVGHYSVEMTDLKSGAKEESVITDFAVLNTVADHAAYIEQLATSRWISTALMPAAFDRVMEDVAERFCVFPVEQANRSSSRLAQTLSVWKPTAHRSYARCSVKTAGMPSLRTHILS